MESHRTHNSSSIKSVTVHVKCINQGTSSKTQHPGFLLEAGPVGTLPSIYETSGVPEGKQMSNINHVVCTVHAQRATLCYHSGNGRNTLEIQVPTNQPEATLVSRLSKESSLEPAVGSLFCTFAHRSYSEEAPINN